MEQSDHKLLADIQLKHLSDTPPRLQGLVQKFNPMILLLSMFQVSRW